VSLATAGELRSAALLRLLALALAPPTPGSVAAAIDLAGALDEDGTDIDVGLLAGALERAGATGLVAAHHRLFGGGVTVAPYESSYELDPFRQARVMADVAGFYRAFGAEAHGPAAERPDHAGTELEFLGLLAERRVAALDEGDPETAERVREIEDAFLTEHAGRWLPGFFRVLVQADPDGAYGALGLVGEQVVASELVARGLEPTASPSSRPPRTAVEEDELSCAAGDDPVGALGI
jgi:TorA maturation chaperone TorD